MASFDNFWTKVDELTVVLNHEQSVEEFEREFSQAFSTEHADSSNFVALANVSSACVQAECSPSAPGPRRDSCRSDIVTLARIEKLIESLVSQLSEGEAPSLSYISRNNWDNIRFKERHGLKLAEGAVPSIVKFDSIQSVNKFALTLRVLSLMYKLVQSNAYCTKRDLYYREPHLFGSQSQVDDIVDNISCLLQVPRWHLNVMATSKGLIAGELQFTGADDTRVDCSLTTTGVMVPHHVQSLKDITSGAKIILVVEKDATFQTLLDDGVCQRLAPCIVITGKGFPDMDTRLMLRRLWDTLRIPVFCIVDADPHGIEILSIYKFGSRSLSFESEHLTVPAVRWLGIMPSDITSLRIPSHALVPLSQADSDKCRELLQRPYIASQPLWKSELEELLRSHHKAEIQSLTSLSESFLTQVYLPSKIRIGTWL